MAVTKNIRKKKKNNSRRKIRVGGTPEQEVAQEVVQQIVNPHRLAGEAERRANNPKPLSLYQVYDWSNIDDVKKLTAIEPLLHTLISNIPKDTPPKNPYKPILYTERRMPPSNELELLQTHYNHREVENGEAVNIEFSSVNDNGKKWAPCILAINNGQVEASGPFTFEDDNTLVLNVQDKFFKETEYYHLGDFKDAKTFLTQNNSGFILLSNLLKPKEIHKSPEYKYTHATPCCMGFHSTIIVKLNTNDSLKGEYILLLQAKQKHLPEEDGKPPIIYKLGPGGSVKDGIKGTLSQEFIEETGIILPDSFNPTDYDNINELEIKVNPTRAGPFPSNLINEHPINVNITSYTRISVNSLTEFTLNDTDEVGGFYLIPINDFLRYFERQESPPLHYKYSKVIKVGNPTTYKGDTFEPVTGTANIGTLTLYNTGNRTKIIREIYTNVKLKAFIMYKKFHPVFLIKSKFDLENNQDLKSLNLIYEDTTLGLQDLYDALGLGRKDSTVESDIIKLHDKHITDIEKYTQVPTGGLKKRKSKKYTKLRKLRKTRKTRKIRK